MIEADEDRAVRCIVVTGAGKAFCCDLAQGPTRAITHAKRLLQRSTPEGLETQMELEAQAIAASGHSEDFRAGERAFAKKLPKPELRGR